MFTNEDYETKLSTSTFNPPKHYSENVIKYITRYRYKNGLEDLNKAKHYIEMLIQLENGEDVNV